MIRSNIGRLIDESPYKRDYIMREMEVSRNTLSNWATGKSHPKAPELFKLARLLNVKVDEMYTYEE